MNNNKIFTRTAVARAVTLLLSGSVVLPLYAQETQEAQTQQVSETAPIEVIAVRGVRSSLQQAAEIKRNSMGVVDAISAEDIGKFPDTNLAESLQRISGVSISRTNGEGSEVTVRGFGADNNMVTLNGRTMPAANTYAAGSGADGTSRGGSSRAFDFSNLASESISGVEVYKTGKANIATGGIGATLNIKTARPLENPGGAASIGVKAAHDTTNRTGSDVTPELSGIFSHVTADDKFGVSVSASHQKRDSGYTGATVNDWQVGYWDDLNAPGRLWNNAGTEVTNAPGQGQLYTRPNDIRYAFSDSQRERDNAQLTLQFRPTERFTATGDYTFAENNIVEHRGEITNWVQTGSNIKEVEFDNNIVKTPTYIKEEYASTVDEGYEQQWREQTNTLTSVGVNFEYLVSEDLTLEFDAHDSKMHSRGTGPRNSGELAVGLGAPIVESREWFWGMDLPTYLNQYNDAAPGKGANANGLVDAGDVGSSIGRIRNASQESDIQQFKLDAKYALDDGHFDFGVEVRTMESRTLQTAGNNIALGNWNVGDPGEFGDLIQPFDLPGEFDDYKTLPGGYGFIADPRALYTAALGLYPGIPTASETTYSADNIVKEDTMAAYFQVALGGEIGKMPFDVLTGLRYEKTESESSSLVSRTFFRWEDNNDIVAYADNTTPAQPFNAENSYDYLLPSLDFTLHLSDDVISRFSFSKTIARAGLGSLGVSASNFGGGGGSTLLGAQPTANASNPGLLPLESSNYDLSLEWYYDNGSYMSAGLFQKDVVNFIGSRQVDQPLLGILDVTGGPRAIAALQAIRNAGFPVDDTHLYAMMVFTEYRNHPDMIAEFGANPQFTGTPEQIDFLANNAGFDLIANPDDPEMEFRTSTPDNNRAAKIHGAELAIQHFFGETGFGVQANYTLVRGDIGFDVAADPGESQFALLGLSDTANLIGIYEKEGWTARVAWNWRDKYLAEVNKGGSNNPRFEEAYWQLDVNLAYDVNEQLTVFVEGLNLTGENSRSHARNEAMLWYLTDLGARYQIGMRYDF
ncbi:MAG: TonB-dependent receptor [Gammaproteobacteria bacterium]|nr:TonB-dependent receptor [Gammaproteobacteria bacterium]MBU2059497.1 TonB-dependent receptor [Gammaproteobacteria bacterium]MBU2176209.1 TonB-dependent receptor [Gammaproteobacteria bacterium]MBU2248142.1 TonB-dependent receptor [Gammaproteobacteria bacterium]MBU2344577.1 TonB-dependent receptor [Gammaproteobacteria bacterium]